MGPAGPPPPTRTRGRLDAKFGIDSHPVGRPFSSRTGFLQDRQPQNARDGVAAMTHRYRSFLLAPLVPAVLLGSLFAVVQAQNAGTPAARQERWSDPATWPGRKVPVAGDAVTIEKGKDVVLDVSPPALGNLTIDGKLSF